jgi:hypothetical protein
MSERRTVLRGLLGVGLVMALAGPAAADHGGIHPTFREERAYIHCAGPTKVHNVNIITDGPAPWDTEAPTQSVQEGAGCGAFDAGALRGTNQENIYDAVFRGEFAGTWRA